MRKCAGNERISNKEGLKRDEFPESLNRILARQVVPPREKLEIVQWLFSGKHYFKSLKLLACPITKPPPYQLIKMLE